MRRRDLGRSGIRGGYRDGGESPLAVDPLDLGDANGAMDEVAMRQVRGTMDVRGSRNVVKRAEQVKRVKELEQLSFDAFRTGVALPPIPEVHLATPSVSQLLVMTRRARARFPTPPAKRSAAR
ncbi:MAG: hypothetical protein JNM80_10325 [Phycisphaerae bacterium]|nr:hypothetical protein [Phycisphaerae bacterium]